MKKRPIARCKLCNTNIIAIDEIQLSILILSHILQKHYNHPRYSGLIKKIVELSKEDFEISFLKNGELK